MIDIIIDTLIDAVKLLPFLFIAFLIIEVFEHKLGEKSKEFLTNTKKIGPIVGSLFGIIPQCGFSAFATNLYATRIISLGTLFAVYLSTSDEMIPILLAEQAPVMLLFKILIVKFLLGIIYGFIIDLFIRKKEDANYQICSSEHCHCDDESLFLSSLKHTFNIFLFIVIFTFLINIVMYYGGEDLLGKLFLKNNIFAPVVTCLIGLIPNCAASTLLTELFLNNAISFGALVGGLLTSAGVGLLVLFRVNKDKKENVFILILLYIIGVISGVIIELFTKIF